MDEYIITDDEFVEESYDDSYEPDDDITLEDVESYLESVKENITDAMELRDNMIQEEYEYEDLSLEDVESYIESNIDVYNDGVDLYNTMIMESDDNLTDDFEEFETDQMPGVDYLSKNSPIGQMNIHGTAIRNANKLNKTNNGPMVDTHLNKKQYNQAKNHLNDIIRKGGLDKATAIVNNKHALKNADPKLEPLIKDQIKRDKKSLAQYNDGRKYRFSKYEESYALTDYRDNEIDLELDEPLTAYEFFDESYEPDDTPIVPRSNESIEYTQEFTLGDLAVLTVAAVALIKTGKALINQFTTGRKYGRFPKDMKRVYDIIESENFEASENKRALKKAFKALSKDLTYMLHGFGSRWKITVNEAEEIRKLKRHVDDLYTHGHMLTSNKQRSDKRRVGERIEGFLKQGNKVLEILNRSIYKNASDDAVTEWMV